MKKLLLLTKTLLAVALLCVGQNAWADTTIGSTSTGWGEGITSAYTLQTGKTLTFTFTVDASRGTNDYDGYVAILAKTSASTWGENQYVFLRSDCAYMIGGAADWNTGALYNTNTYGETGKVGFFTGATVNMAIKRVGKNVLITTAITKDETTYYHYYQQNLGTTDDVYAFLAADYAQLTITGDAITDNGLTEETYDFTTNSTKSSSTSAWGEIVNSSYYILSNSYVDMKGRFAGGKYSSGGSGGWTIMANSVGMRNTNSNSSKGFCILNLSEGDYIVINYDTQGTSNITFSSGNIAGEESGTVVVSGEAYKISSAGYLQLNFARNATVQSIEIHTSTPVLSAPTISFDSMVESEGYYNPKYTFSSADDGVTFYDGDGNDISSGYTFTAAGTLTFYASKAGRTSSAKTSYTVDATRVGMILANSVEDGDLVGTVNYETGEVLADNKGIGGAKWVIPGLDFSGSSITYRTWGIMPTSGPRSVICNVLNENRVATYEHYDYVTKTTGYDYLTSSSNSATLKRKDKDNYDRFTAYALYVSPSEEVSVTIGSTGYSTFSSPVPLNFAGIDGLTAYVATSVADGTVNLTSVETAPANTGLVLKGTADQEYSIPVTNAAVAPASNLLVGCIVETPVAVDATSKFNNYVLAIEGGVAKFQSLVDMGATIPAGKAFLKNGAVGGGSARSMRIVFDDNITGVANVEAATEAKAKEGKFIENGKLVIVKNGQKFNAAGAKLY